MLPIGSIFASGLWLLASSNSPPLTRGLWLAASS